MQKPSPLLREKVLKSYLLGGHHKPGQSRTMYYSVQEIGWVREALDPEGATRNLWGHTSLQDGDQAK